MLLLCVALRARAAFTYQSSGRTLIPQAGISLTKIKHYCGSYHGSARSFTEESVLWCLRELFSARSVVKCIVSLMRALPVLQGGTGGGVPADSCTYDLECPAPTTAKGVFRQRPRNMVA